MIRGKMRKRSEFLLRRSSELIERWRTPVREWSHNQNEKEIESVVRRKRIGIDYTFSYFRKNNDKNSSPPCDL